MLVADQRVGPANRRGSAPTPRFPAQQLLVPLWYCRSHEQSLVQTNRPSLLPILFTSDLKIGSRESVMHPPNSSVHLAEPIVAECWWLISVSDRRIGEVRLPRLDFLRNSF